MGMFRKKQVTPETKIQTLAEMVAYSLCNAATRTTWKAAGNDEFLVSDDLCMRINCRWPRGNHCYELRRANGHVVPMSESDKRTISRGVESWRAWDDERKRTNALVAFVEKFEAAYGTNA